MPLLTRLIPIVVVLGAWELVARAGVVNPNVFPPVSEIAVRLVQVFADGRIWAPLWGTLWRAPEAAITLLRTVRNLPGILRKEYAAIT